MSNIYKNYDLSRITHAKHTKVKIPFTLYSLISTWFFIGRIRFASGTLGTLGFYPLYYWLLLHAADSSEAILNLWICTVVLFILGLWAVTAFQNNTKTFDHSSIVIDEVIGMSLTLAISFKWLYLISQSYFNLFGISQMDLTFIIAFIGFRFFDIKKPFFIKYVDRYYKNPFGVILDDLLAAIFAGVVFYILYVIYDFFRFL